MPTSGQTFAKGGCGCLLLFFALGFLAVIFGGRAHIDLGGIIILFVIGGIIALTWRAVFGKKENAREMSSEEHDENVPEYRTQTGTGIWTCACCGNVNRAGDDACLSCDWPRGGKAPPQKGHGYREKEDNWRE